MISVISLLSEIEQTQKGKISTKGEKFESSRQNQLPQGQLFPPGKASVRTASMNRSLFSQDGMQMAGIYYTLFIYTVLSWPRQPGAESPIPELKTQRLVPSCCTGQVRVPPVTATQEKRHKNSVQRKTLSQQPLARYERVGV